MPRILRHDAPEPVDDLEDVAELPAGLRPDLRRARRVAAGALAVGALLGLWGWGTMIRMPGESYRGALPELSAAQATLRDRLEADVRTIALDIGERHSGRYDALAGAADFIEEELERAGHEARRQSYAIGGQSYDNVEVELPGTERPREVVVVGAHYDSEWGTPGANDNGTGVAALLALARRLRDARPRRTLRLVAFVNEEMPHFRDGTMGSGVYARRCRDRREQITAMLSLETIGYFSDEPGSQRYPFPLGALYPDRGDFIGFIGNVASRGLVRRSIGAFRRAARFPSEGGALPGWIPGVGWSDHASFWAEAYPAIMVTDTAPFRYPHYHRRTDTPDRIDYGRLARVVDGVAAVVDDLTDGP